MMQSSCKDGTKNSVSFFTALRRLGREVDQGVKTIQEQLDGRHLSCESNKHVALKGLLDRRKEVDTLKSHCRTLVSEMRERGKTFEQTLQACGEVIDLQLEQLSTLQAHLTQYGFVPQPECDDSAEEGAEETGSEVEATSASTPPQERETKDKLEKRNNLTPRLEDFGVSSFTLNMLNKRPQPLPFKVPVAAVPQRVPTRNEATRHDSVPEMFRNDGLTVTPSLFSTKSYGSGNRSGFEAYSPDMVNAGCVEVDSSLQDRPTEVVKTLDFSDSPVPPVLQTPGIKQIPHIAEGFSPPPPGKRGPVARQLKLGDGVGAREDEESMDSPVPPVLSTPGIPQISRTSVPAVSKTSKTLEMPRTPQFTYSFKDLEDMTMSFKQTDLSSTFSEQSATTSSSSSDLDVSGPRRSAAQQGVGDGRVPPPLPQPRGQVTGSRLSNRMVDSLAVSQPPQLSSWSRQGAGTDSLDLPPTPELTMSYSSRFRPAPTTTLPSTHACRQAVQDRFSQQSGERWGESYGGERSLLSAADVPVNRSQAGGRFNTENQQCEKRLGLSHKQYVPPASSAFLSSYSSDVGRGVPERHGGVLRSTENRLSPVRAEEESRKAERGVRGPAVPDQPVLRHPLTEASLDLPATPKFMGSYHFMGSKH